MLKVREFRHRWVPGVLLIYYHSCRIAIAIAAYETVSQGRRLWYELVGVMDAVRVIIHVHVAKSRPGASFRKASLPYLLH